MGIRYTNRSYNKIIYPSTLKLVSIVVCIPVMRTFKNNMKPKYTFIVACSSFKNLIVVEYSTHHV